jgi:hypothetical protein
MDFDCLLLMVLEVRTFAARENLWLPELLPPDACDFCSLIFFGFLMVFLPLFFVTLVLALLARETVEFLPRVDREKIVDDF